MPEPLVPNRSVTDSIFENSTRERYNYKFCFFRALVFHLPGFDKLEEKSCKLSSRHIQKLQDVDATKLQSICLIYIPTVKDSNKTNTSK